MPSRFLKSAVHATDFPEPKQPEVAFLGRSNAGKSSLLNAYMQQKLAHVGQTPGKTRLINFFDFDGKYTLVDLPGYGFAKVAEKERRAWKDMIESYLVGREVLACCVLVLDSKRPWTGDEEDLTQWLKGQGIPVFIALTKVDKLKQSEKAQRRREYQQMGLEDVFFVSGRTGQGVDKLRQQVYKRICEFLV